MPLRSVLSGGVGEADRLGGSSQDGIGTPDGLKVWTSELSGISAMRV